MIEHCTHWRSWMVGPGRIVEGEVCCKCDLIVEEGDLSECHEEY